MFIGRGEYFEMLGALWGRDTGVLVTCRGRRRIGKSTLIEEFAARTADRFISIDGLPPRPGLDDDAQRRHFCEKVAEHANRAYVRAETWSQAFAQLDGILAGGGRTVVLLDEISWMGGSNPDFAGYLKEAWDRKLRKHADLVFVLCGSVSSWIAENILDSTGFVGRNSLDLEVGELPLRDCVRMFGESGGRLSEGEIFDILSLTGGVPKYLEEIRPEISVDENVRKTCFLPQGLLFREFDETFSSVFGRKVKSRGMILRRLADGAQSLSELSRSAGTESHGGFTKALRDLQLAGFIKAAKGLNPETGRPLRQERYRIRDNYARFYLKFVEPRKQAIADGLFRFASLEQLHGWETVLGLQFENLVLNHVGDLLPLLGLDHSLVLSAAPYVQRPTTAGEGCQVDLLIQTQRTAFVVEIKRRDRIGHEVIDEVARKVARLRRRKALSVRTALVYAGELAKSVPADRYFDFIIPAGRLLGR